MVPPRTTKKSSLTTVTQTASRQGVQLSQKQLVESVEELDDVDHTDSIDIDGELDDEGGADPEGSRGTQNGPLGQLVVNMVDSSRRRFAAQKKGVNEKYIASCAAVQDSIDAVFDEHQEKASSAHRAQLTRLQELLARKVTIETAMAKKLATLRAEYDAHSRDLERVLEHRVKDLK